MPSTALRRRDRKAGAPAGGEDPARSSAGSAIAAAGNRLAALPGSWLLVAGAVVWNLINLRAETWAVSYLDDSSLHEQMVRFATTQLRAGHLPLTSWFPFLGEGSPHFLHYQSLPATLTGTVGLVTGSNVAFRWSLYLLWCLWPISVYLAGRLFGFGKWPSALAAAMAPFLMSPIAVGYEQKAYIWVGYGVWAQLWASWTLPLAWGFSWRAIRGEGRLLAAVVFVSLTTALHYETGYMALLPLLLWPFVAPAELRRRIARAAVIAGGTLLACAWVIVPLIDQRPWAATNELLQQTPLVNGYGAGKMLDWLVTGRLLDNGRFPIVTLFAAVGLAVAIASWRRQESYRALVLVFLGCLLLTFGRTTFGALIDLIPGNQDLFFRRFIGGVHLAALLLAGVGAAWVGAQAWNGVRGSARRLSGRPPGAPASAWALTALACVAIVAVLAPAWSQLHTLDVHNAQSISDQRRADATQGADVNRLAAIARRRGDGRVYAGSPSNWGTTLQVGAVPVFKYLESQDVDEVGYTLRTASLMTDPEFFLHDGMPSNYDIFGIRYLILGSGQRPPVPARRLQSIGPYVLWRTQSGGYMHAGRTSGAIRADRTNIGYRTRWFLRSPLALSGVFPAVRFESGPPLPAPPGAASPSATAALTPAVGSVVAERVALTDGRADARVRMRAPGIAVLSASFDPGWRATVDGKPVPTRMVAPALVAADVPAGTHAVTFHYVGYGGYAVLFALCALTLIALAVVDRRQRRGAGVSGRAVAAAAAVVLIGAVLAGCNSTASGAAGTGNTGRGNSGIGGIGSTGAAGGTGSTGSTGSTGTTGSAGSTGSTGGSTGSTGGSTGSTGGAAGSSGSTGGVAGSTGSTGSAGSTGEHGRHGRRQHREHGQHWRERRQQRQHLARAPPKRSTGYGGSG